MNETCQQNRAQFEIEWGITSALKVGAGLGVFRRMAALFILPVWSLAGEDKLRPYDFNHDWGSSVGADLACLIIGSLEGI